uniref:Ig-like domain-containing protein n=1 Tax=Heterorhabditis bacteriophora TaxID=37862 RepID=A0A1I7WV68_HETBA
MRWKRNLFRFLLSIFPLVAAIDDPARLVVRPDPSSVVDGSRISFFCRADGNPLPNVVWKVNGGIITDSRFVSKSLPSGLSTLRIEPVRSTDNASVVSCAADNGVANPVVADAILTVLNKGVVLFEVVLSKKFYRPFAHGISQHRCSSFSQICRARKNGSCNMQRALMIQQAREEDQGKYECVARNIHGGKI